MTSTTAANLSSNWGSDDDADDDDDDDDGGFDGDDFDDFEDVDDEDDEDFERRLSSSSSVMEASSSESLKRDIFLLPLIVPEKVFYRNFTVFQFFTSLNFSTKASQKMDRERKKIRYKRMKLETKKGLILENRARALDDGLEVVTASKEPRETRFLLRLAPPLFQKPK